MDFEDGQLTNRYLWSTAVDQLLADERLNGSSGGSDLRWTLTDHLGSVRALADTNGSVVDTAVYDAFGLVLGGAADAAIDSLFGYTGRPLDEATGLQNNHHRWYDATTGKWLSQDPIGFAAGDANLYRYVENQPTVQTDPSGLDGWESIEKIFSSDHLPSSVPENFEKKSTEGLSPNSPEYERVVRWNFYVERHNSNNTLWNIRLSAFSLQEFINPFTYVDYAWQDLRGWRWGDEPSPALRPGSNERTNCVVPLPSGRGFPKHIGPAHSAVNAARLRSQLALQERLARGGKFVGPAGEALLLGQSRVAVFDTVTGKIYYDVSNAGSHLGVLQRHGLPTTIGRYAGGFIEATDDGCLIFKPISGTFPHTELDLPGNVLDLIRGTGVSIPKGM